MRLMPPVNAPVPKDGAAAKFLPKFEKLGRLVSAGNGPSAGQSTEEAISIEPAQPLGRPPKPRVDHSKTPKSLRWLVIGPRRIASLTTVSLAVICVIKLTESMLASRAGVVLTHSRITGVAVTDRCVATEER